MLMFAGLNMLCPGTCLSMFSLVKVEMVFIFAHPILMSPYKSRDEALQNMGRAGLHKSQPCLAFLSANVLPSGNDAHHPSSNYHLDTTALMGLTNHGKPAGAT